MRRKERRSARAATARLLAVRRRRLAAGLLAAAAGALLAAAFPGTGWASVRGLRWCRSSAHRRRKRGDGVSFGWIAGALSRALPALDSRDDCARRPVRIARPVDSRAAATATLALYPALFAAGLRHWQIRVGVTGSRSLSRCWVALEWCRSTLFLPCPWDLLGYRLARPFAPAPAACDLAGIYGVSALVVAVNHGAATAALAGAPRGSSVCGLLARGLAPRDALRRSPPDRDARNGRSDTVRVALVQRRSSQGIKWDPNAPREARSPTTRI